MTDVCDSQFISIYSFARGYAVLLNWMYIDSAIKSLMKQDEIVAIWCGEILR